jgi:hypothetical protein
MTQRKGQRSRNWEKNRTMISIRFDTKNELEHLGYMKDTYDSVITRLLKFRLAHKDLWEEFSKTN